MQVIALINEAQLCDKDEKVACLQQVCVEGDVACLMTLQPLISSVHERCQVKELITKKDTNLLDSFLDVRDQKQFSRISAHSILCIVYVCITL